jgi:DNA-binding GntR family transcriptional regulator
MTPGRTGNASRKVEEGNAVDLDPLGKVSRAQGGGVLKLGSLNRILPLGEQAAQSLRTALRRGELLPGQRLTVRDVASTLDVSLTPAREAINRLVAERVLELSGERVAIVPVLTRARYGELCEIRLNLESLAARASCLLMDDETVAYLERLYAAHAKAYAARDAKASLRCNEDFHFTIYAKAGKSYLLQLLETLWLQVGPSMNLLFHAAYSEDWKPGRNHRAMLDAIHRRDPAGLARAVRRDLLEGRERLSALLPGC